jgi:hypothetical protein
MKKLAFAVLSVGFFVGSSLAFAACSSDSSTPATGDGGSESGRPPLPPPQGGDDSSVPDAAPTHDQCIKQCETDHADGLALDKKIDDCWATNCQAPCVDGTGGFDAGTGDAGDGGEGGVEGGVADAGPPMCQNGVETGDTTCNLCTQTYCCGAWDGCFNDKGCSDLNACRSACPP